MRILRGFSITLALVGLMWLSGPQPANAAADCVKWGVTYSLDLAPGFWTPGYHTYELRSTDARTGSIFQEAGWFWIDSTAALHDGEVMFRRGLAAPYSIDGQIQDHRINPGQDTLFQLRVTDPTGSRTAAEGTLNNVTIAWRWDVMTDWVTGTHGPAVPACSADPAHAGFWLRDWGPDFTFQ